MKQKNSVKTPDFFHTWTEDEWCDCYNQWIEYVKLHIPVRIPHFETFNLKLIMESTQAENLLIFNAKMGWEPLCEFLGVPVPENQPYPSSNDSKTFHENFSNAKIPQ